MKKIPNLNRKTIFRISAFLVVAALVVVFFPRGKSGFKYRYAENKPWGYTTLAAPFDFPLYKSDVQVEKERAQHMESFYPYFRFVPGQQQKILVVSYNDYEWLENNYKKIMVRTTDTKAKSHLITELTTPKNAYQGNQKIAYPQNLVYDTLYTEKMRVEKLAEIKDVEGQIFKGTKIIEEGEIVNAYTYRVLESLSRAYKEMAPGKQQRTLTLIGESILVLLFISLFVVYLFVFRNSYVQKTSVVLFFCLQILLVIALLINNGLLSNLIVDQSQQLTLEDWFAQKGLSYVGNYLLYIIIAVIALVVVIIRLTRNWWQKRPALVKVADFFKGIWRGFVSIKDIPNPWHFVFWTVAMWICYYLGVYCFFHALPYLNHIGPGAAFTVLIFGTIAFMISQGGLGSYPLITAGIVMLYGIPYTQGLAAGWIGWILQTAVSLILGLFSLVITSLYKRHDATEFPEEQ